MVRGSRRAPISSRKPAASRQQCSGSGPEANTRSLKPIVMPQPCGPGATKAAKVGGSTNRSTCIGRGRGAAPRLRLLAVFRYPLRPLMFVALSGRRPSVSRQAHHAEIGAWRFGSAGCCGRMMRWARHDHAVALVANARKESIYQRQEGNRDAEDEGLHAGNGVRGPCRSRRGPLRNRRYLARAGETARYLGCVTRNCASGSLRRCF